MDAQDSAGISVVAPIYNEEESLPRLHQALTGVLRELARPYEIILVDDGSRDGSWAEICRLAAGDEHCVGIRLRRNFGQAAALAAGIDRARGATIVLIDADLQNDPADIPRLLRTLEDGYDIASGWRKDRRDPFFSRTLPSKTANWLISRVTGVHLHDYGCTLKAYRREVLESVRLYGEMHRFIPALAALSGAAVTEVPVKHHPRRFGRSKYGINRTLKVLLDLLTVKFLGSYGTKPIYVFGGGGALSIVASFLILAWLVYEKLSLGRALIQSPLLLLSTLLFLVGVQLLALGLLAELIIRTWYESQDKKIYVVRDVVMGRAAAVPPRSDPAIPGGEERLPGARSAASPTASAASGAFP